MTDDIGTTAAQSAAWLL